MSPMNGRYDTLQLLRQVAEGSVPPEEALLQLKQEPFQDLGYAKVDHHRGVRQGGGGGDLRGGQGPDRKSVV